MLSIEPNSIIRSLQKHLRPLGRSLFLLYGFGSHFSGQSHLESDLDLAILCDAPLTVLQQWSLKESLALELHKEIDLIDLIQCAILLKWEILQTGKLLFQQEAHQADAFETYVWSASLRFQEARRDVLEDILKRGNIYGSGSIAAKSSHH